MAAGLGDRFALTPEVEAARRDALRQRHILHTPPEERFARITRLARPVFRVPIAAISLMDEQMVIATARAAQAVRMDSHCGEVAS